MGSSAAYMKDYMLRRYQRRKAEIVERLGGKCSKCDSITGLEIDHKDPATKSFTFGKCLVSKNQAAVEEEIKKCQLLCQTCHEEKSLQESGKKRAKGTHGTISSYRYCRCVLCKEAKAKSNHEQHLRRGVAA